jgi:hypothetical protein
MNSSAIDKRTQEVRHNTIVSICRLGGTPPACSLVEVPGFTPRSMRSWAFHRYTVASASPSSAATTRTGLPARTSSTTWRRNPGS